MYIDDISRNLSRQRDSTSARARRSSHFHREISGGPTLKLCILAVTVFHKVRGRRSGEKRPDVKLNGKVNRNDTRREPGVVEPSPNPRLPFSPFEPVPEESGRANAITAVVFVRNTIRIQSNAVNFHAAGVYATFSARRCRPATKLTESAPRETGPAKFTSNAGRLFIFNTVATAVY